MPTILGIESTCDETAAAVVVDGYDVRTNVIASQAELHAKYRGVVPEIACRAHIENLLPVLTDALPSLERDSGAKNLAARLAGVDAIAVAHRPGLIGSLLVGVTAAKTLAWAAGKPLIGVDHVHAHLYSVVLESNRHPDFPAIGLVVSGGHTALYRIGSWHDIELIGSTIDDAVGEAYDKVAAMLGLGYPGGPILDRLAQQGDPKKVQFPRTMLAPDSLDFSFSGLKTAALYHVYGVPSRGRRPDTSRPPDLSEQALADIAASFQAACVEVIAKKLRRAVEQTGARSVVVGGGVSANAGLRRSLEAFAVPVYFPGLSYCTDNAAMIAGLAAVYFRANEFSPLDLDAVTHSRFRGS